MLVFCEDCGEKNIIDPDRTKTENNHYRCSTCNFLNTYHPLAESKPTNVPTASPQEKNHHKENKAKKVSTNSKLNQAKRQKLNAHKKPYSTVFKNIGTEKEILGAYVYHFHDGLIAYDVDQVMTEETMRQIGKAFSVCSPFGHKILKKTKEICLVLDNQAAVCRNVTMNSILVLFCQNYPMQTSSATVFEQSIKNIQASI